MTQNKGTEGRKLHMQQHQMTNSSALVSSVEWKDPLLQKVDDTIERCIGSFGWAQFLQAVLVSFAWAFDAQQTFISVFTDSEPRWHCIQPYNESCNSAPNQCGLPKSAWAWDVPVQTSVISSWNLECSSPIITGLPTSSFFMGCIAGGLVLAALADSSFGRKNLLVLSCLIMSLAGALTVVFSPNVWVYSSLRFISGFGRGTIGTCALVLSSETVGKRWRGEVGIVGFLCSAIGFLSLPAIAYMNRDSSWQTLYLWTSIPGIFYSVLAHFVLHESPRWLFVQGRKEEAVNTLKCISSNNLSLNFSGVSIEQETCNDIDLYSSIKLLWEKKWALRRLSTVMIVGFGIGMVYHGMPLGLSNLAFSNLYLSATLNALLELPASLITFFLIGRLNRRSVLLVFTIVSGVCSVACAVIDNGLQIGLELVSFFSACTSLNVLLIYILELFPTCVRNSAVSMVRQAIVFGGVFSPVLLAAGRRDGAWLSYGVFGVVIGCFGLFVVGLPETRGGTLCDTMDEQEYNGGGEV